MQGARGHRAKVKNPPLKEKGTEKGTLTREINELEQKKGDLNKEWREQQRRLEDIEKKIEKQNRTKERLDTSIEETRHGWVREAEKLRVKLEEKRREYREECRMMEKLREEYDHLIDKKEAIIALFQFLTDPDKLSNKQHANITNMFIRTGELRKKPGNLGKAMKLTRETSEKIVELLRKTIGEDYISREEHEQTLERKLEARARNWSP